MDITTTVLIVDDSATARLALRKAVEKSPDLRVVGEAETPNTAMRLIRQLDPNIVTMDVHLGRFNGIQLTEQIMSESPRPVVVVTGINPSDPELIYRALEAGALEVVGKPPAPDRPQYPESQQKLVRLIRTLAKVPVVTRRRRGRPAVVLPDPVREPVSVHSTSSSASTRIVVIGASTGGPPSLGELLSVVPLQQPWPIAIVQHIGNGFAKGFAQWLEEVTGHKVVLVDEPHSLRSGHVYVADGDRHARLVDASQIVPDLYPRTNCRPSVDVLFESAARQFGHGAVGVLLTGMGSDGVAGLRALKEVGAMTIAQSLESCVVAGMPKAAIEAGVVERIASISGIGKILRELANRDCRKVQSE